MSKRDLPDINPIPSQDGGEGYNELSKALGDIDFPVTQQELLQAVGTRTIEVGKGHVISLRTLLQRTGVGHFPTMSDLLQTIHSTLLLDGLIDEDWAA